VVERGACGSAGVGRWLRRVVAVLAVVGLGALVTPGTAAAGGPTSVLLACPQHDRAAALYTGDPAYERLLDLLGEEPVADPAPPPTDSGTTYVTLTWLVHDVDVWRIDRAFLDTTGGPWLVTRTATDTTTSIGDGMWPGERGGPGAVWHRPSDPQALLALFGELGLLRTPPGPAVVQTVREPVAAPAAVPAPPAPTGDGLWWWAGAGALVGAAGAVLALRGSAGLRRRVLAGRAEEPVG
jgi:hypothetical protein